MMNQKGRSMIEMLGVLAIIGVLSVGGLAGYQKAMFKHRLNRQTEQLDTLLNAMSRYKNEWRDIREYIFLTPYFIRFGEIPNEMIRNNSTDYIYDIFNNKIALRNNQDTEWNKVKINYYINNKESFELCQNIWLTVKSFANELYKGGVYVYEGETSPQGSQYFYGNNFCDSSRCIKNLSLDDIYSMCTLCKEDNQTCLFQILWKI